MLKDIYKNFPTMKRYAIILGFVLFVGAGFFGTVQGQLTKSVADAIGNINAPSGIQKGMWLRYDTYITGNIPSRWNLTSGTPHIIANCTGVTTTGALNDFALHLRDASSTAYNWSVTPYWSNGQEATDLLNGNTTNSIWTCMLKPIRDGGQLFQVGDDATRMLRIFGYRDIAPWSIQQIITGSSSPWLSNIKGLILSLGGVYDPTSIFSWAGSFWTDVNWSKTPSSTHLISMTGAWDADTQLLYFVQIYDFTVVNSTWTNNGFGLVYLSDCSNNVNLFNKPPQLAPTPFVVVPVVGQSYKYAIDINQGLFDKALITVRSNDTSAIANVTNATTITNMYPLDNVKPAKVNITVIISVHGLISQPNTISVELSKFDPIAKLAAVTNASVTVVGASWKVTWNSTKNANDYRILLNGTTFRMVTPANASVQMVEIQPPAGIWSVSIVADLVTGNSTNETAGIVHAYLLTNPEPNNVGVSSSTGITQPLSQTTLWIIGGVIVAGIVVVAFLVFYLMKIGKLPKPEVKGAKTKTPTTTKGKKTKPMS